MKHLIPRDAAHPPKPDRRKPRNRRKLDFKLLFRLFCLSALLSCVGSYALQTPALTVKQVEIKGVQLADRAAVERAAGTLLGRNIILVRKTPVIETIKALSEVSSVRVGRTLPDKIWLRISERRAAAVLSHRGNLYLLQQDGLAFHACKKPVRGIPVIESADCRCAKAGMRLSSAGVCSALNVVKLARERRLRVAKISIDRLGDMCLNMGSGCYVKLGQPDEMARKLSLLKDALAYKSALVRDAAYINLSCPNAPVWKPKSSVGPAS